MLLMAFLIHDYFCMIFNQIRLFHVFKCCVAGLLLLSGLSIAQTRSSVGQFSVSITLNGTATVAAGSCITQTLFNQTGAVVRVTCVDNPFVNIAPSIAAQFPGTFGSTFRYPLSSNSDSFNFAGARTNKFNPVSGSLNSVGISSLFIEESTSTVPNIQGASGRNASGRSFNSRFSTITDLSIYRTAPQATTDAQGLMDMVISF